MFHRAGHRQIRYIGLALAAIGLVAFCAVAPVAHAAEEVLINLTFDDKKIDEDLTKDWQFFAAGSETTDTLTADQKKRAGAKFIVKADPKDPNNKVLWLAGGDTLMDDCFIYVPSLSNAEIAKGDYTAIQLDFFAGTDLRKAGPKKIIKRAGPHRIGVLGLIDPSGKESYGAWMRWSDRQIRVGRLTAGVEDAKRSVKLGMRNDVDKWYTIRADFKRVGDNVEINGTMWDRERDIRRVMATNTVPLTAKDKFGIGIYQYTCSEKFNYDKRFIDNLKVIRSK